MRLHGMNRKEWLHLLIILHKKEAQICPQLNISLSTPFLVEKLSLSHSYPSHTIQDCTESKSSDHFIELTIKWIKQDSRLSSHFKVEPCYVGCTTQPARLLQHQACSHHVPEPSFPLPSAGEKCSTCCPSCTTAVAEASHKHQLSFWDCCTVWMPSKDGWK